MQISRMKMDSLHFKSQLRPFQGLPAICPNQTQKAVRANTIRDLPA